MRFKLSPVDHIEISLILERFGDLGSMQAIHIACRSETEVENVRTVAVDFEDLSVQS